MRHIHTWAARRARAFSFPRLGTVTGPDEYPPARCRSDGMTWTGAPGPGWYPGFMSGTYGRPSLQGPSLFWLGHVAHLTHTEGRTRGG